MSGSLQRNANGCARIWDGRGFDGIDLEEMQNIANDGGMSSAGSRVAAGVIHTDQERLIAETICCVLGLSLKKEN
ncbi:MAG: hypothetical protein WCE61_00165 [Candidatus Acidiferrum sp.]